LIFYYNKVGEDMETSPELKEAARRLGLAVGKAAALQVIVGKKREEKEEKREEKEEKREEKEGIQRTVRSLWRNICTAILLLPKESLPIFWEGVGQGLAQTRVEVGDVLLLLTGIEGGPQYQVVARFSFEEAKSGAVLRTSRGGFRAVNEPALCVNKGIIEEFRRIAERKKRAEEGAA
jgi:hypothetical protein